MVEYGKVPRGYAQEYPTQGSPEPLRTDEEYRLSCDTGLLRFKVTRHGIKYLDQGDLHTSQ